MLNIAVRAARAAGSIINRAASDLDILKVASKGTNDFVTEVDRAAEEAIIDILLDAYPRHGILAEESGRERGNRDSEFVWIIDPLDGTTNFIHGFPVYAVSIALAVRGRVEQAVVFDPTRNDLFVASKGRGAFLNDRRLRVSRRTRMAEALIGTGFPFRRGDNFQRYLKMFEDVLPHCAGVRRPGAAALDLCYVAAGWYDGFFETGLSPWDMAAGTLMITEAGGLVGNFTGEADYLYQRELVAGTPKVYAQLVKLLAPYSRVIASTVAEPGPAGVPASGASDAATEAFLADAAFDAGSVPQASGAEPAASLEQAAAPAPRARRILKADLPSPGAQGDADPRAPGGRRPSGRASEGAGGGKGFGKGMGSGKPRRA
jgi:myo-inositol-1(or 4)-monophosphatase